MIRIDTYLNSESHYISPDHIIKDFNMLFNLDLNPPLKVG